jgi:hypothetical protein
MNHGRVRELLELLEEAAGTGLDVSYDVYPYEAASTMLTAFLPPPIRFLPRQEALEALRSESFRREFVAQVDAGSPTGMDVGWSDLRVGTVSMRSEGPAQPEHGAREGSFSRLIHTLLRTLGAADNRMKWPGAARCQHRRARDRARPLSEHERAESEHMPRPKDIATKATRESRAKGGKARAEKIRAEKDEQRRLLAEARREQLDAAIERLASAAEAAAATIMRLLAAPNDSIRLRAAMAVLEILDAAEMRELADRLDRLEQLASTNGHR